ncbi:MAG: methyltransferase domain-containing protein [Acidobacteria bacterium]|nr:methyltransferase domain-containing protein [Acidobacteriota bacterium]
MHWLRRLLGAKPAPPPLAEIKQAFEDAAGDEEHFPSTIDPRIYHVQLLVRTFGPLDGLRVLDAGCGKGRFARVLRDRHPAGQYHTLDLSEAMLRRVPEGMHRCCGTLTGLPYRGGTFDAVYATESLEHAVDIDAAVAELCRVLKKGGKLVIIDKNRAHWGKLKTPPWERWFRRGELEQLLARHCARVSSKPVSYWEDVPPDGLFLAWIAER